MCCATANNPSKSTKDKESARSIVTAILLCLIGKKKKSNKYFLRDDEGHGNERKL
jgi:hypothetical protein